LLNGRRRGGKGAAGACGGGGVSLALAGRSGLAAAFPLIFINVEQS
jgi:hypothetical protein